MSAYTFYVHAISGDIATLSDWQSDYRSMDVESWHGKSAEECTPESWIADGKLTPIDMESNDECFLTNNVFQGWRGDAKDGETYMAEWACYANDADGNRYMIVWRFDLTKGDEPDGDCLPWHDEKNIYKVMAA